MSEIVPGVMRCPKCKFVLTRTTLYVGNGTAGPGDNKTEPCPNGCGPLWPMTWRDQAQQFGERLEEMHEEVMALRHTGIAETIASFIETYPKSDWDHFVSRSEVAAAVRAKFAPASSGE